jgi:iron-sulfur cluster assembly accessory protein
MEEEIKNNENKESENNPEDNVNKINVDMKIQDIVEKYPRAVEVLMEAGVHCVGCHVAQWESLGEGLKNHGKSDEEIADLIKKMNEKVKDIVLPQYVGEEERLLVTKEAIEEMKKQLQEGQYLRINVKLGGCCGFNYAMSVDTEKKDDDEIIEIEGVKFLVVKESLGFIAGSKIEYIASEQAFRISAPNGGSCGGC